MFGAAMWPMCPMWAWLLWPWLMWAGMCGECIGLMRLIGPDAGFICGIPGAIGCALGPIIERLVGPVGGWGPRGGGLAGARLRATRWLEAAATGRLDRHRRGVRMLRACALDGRQRRDARLGAARQVGLAGARAHLVLGRLGLGAAAQVAHRAVDPLGLGELALIGKEREVRVRHV